ncbi:MAG: tRNA (N(6)-L-threonylcarbamoyladenosine(37)-C(2))-methylthiotransferase MtaB [Schleiferiaceae bacterium]|nr:tRNA (N(6)-L-threonylcarbamoyladenosine(37)-C(2))-methylthiotransferase MtaB [Schleiferiaceae bacterium]
MKVNGKKVAFHTLGCKLNFSETAGIARDISQRGFEQVDFQQWADVYVINTCSVTQNADKECRYWVRKALESNPEAYVAIIGCYAQLQPEEIAQIQGVDLVLGATEKFKLHQYLHDLTKNEIGEVHSCEINEADFYVSAYSLGDRTRAFLKVQDGCDYKCTYCTIPQARGISRSDSLDNVLANAREIALQGIREIVLTGVNIGDYGKGEHGNKRHDHTFLDLVQALDEVPGLERLRISSIEPNLLKDETIRFVAHSQHFVPHFHIPLQSGSNKLLRRMKRRYQRELYADRVAEIRRHLPQAAIGVDVICGFPGESEEDFLETYRFLNELDISYLHVFTYSQRPGTEADAMPDQVPYALRKKRSKMLRGLSVKKRRAFYEAQLHTSHEVLWEDNFKAGYITGYTENYVKVKALWEPALVNQKQLVNLTEIDDDGLVRATIVQPQPA